MARKGNAVAAASERMSILRDIVRRERERAEANPASARNIEIGLTEQDQTRDEARRRIGQVFDELGYLIDHLSVAHMATAFEAAAKARMATIIGESRSAIVRARKGKERWPENLVRGMKSFEGLSDLATVMGLDSETQDRFSVIRNVRNAFSHEPQIGSIPAITENDTLNTLSDMLDAMK